MYITLDSMNKNGFTGQSAESFAWAKRQRTLYDQGNLTQTIFHSESGS